MKIVLGPCPCHHCGELLFWNGWEWKNYARRPGTDHDCRAKRKAA